MGRGLSKRLTLVLISSREPGCSLLLPLGVASEAPEDKVASRRRLTSRGCEGRLPEMGGVWGGGGRALNTRAPEDTRCDSGFPLGEVGIKGEIPKLLTPGLPKKFLCSLF